MNEPRPPLPQTPHYLNQVCELLRDGAGSWWEMIDSEGWRARQAESIGLDLLKSTERLPPSEHARLYDNANEAARTLELEIPVHLYQSRVSPETNVSVGGTTKAAHIVFYGDAMERLKEPELRAVMGHELGHLRLWQTDNQQNLASLAVLTEICRLDDVDPVFKQTLRYYRLNMEIFCDRCALANQRQIEPVLSSLARMACGSNEFDIDQFVRDQNVATTQSVTTSIELPKYPTHPDLSVRADALRMWQRDLPDLENRIDRLVRGPLTLDSMDLVAQPVVTRWIRLLVDQMLYPDWIRRESILNAARQYFPDYHWPAQDSQPNWPFAPDQPGHDLVTNCFVYVLLDFVTAERELLEPALAHAITLAERLGVAEPFEEFTRRELRLRKKQFQQIRTESESLVARVRSGQKRFDVSSGGGTP